MLVLNNEVELEIKAEDLEDVFVEDIMFLYNRKLSEAEQKDFIAIFEREVYAKREESDIVKSILLLFEKLSCGQRDLIEKLDKQYLSIDEGQYHHRHLRTHNEGF